MMRWLALLALAAGCSSGGPGRFDLGAADLFSPGDQGSSDDLAPPPDLALSGGKTSYVMHKMIAPMVRTDFSIDLNGDGRVDNQLGNIVGALNSQNLDAQTNIDLAISSGIDLSLLSLRSADPGLVTDPMAGATLYLAQDMANPNFTGMGMFTIDQAQPPSVFSGALASAAFSSEDPITTKKPVDFILHLPLLSPTETLALPLHGAHVQFKTSTKPPGLLMGQIHGSIKNSDVQSTIIPAIAKSLNDQVQADPNSQSTMQILAIFDVGGCGAAQANDKRIDTCEVATNQIIQNVLAPDVQIYDAMGNYAPNAMNSMKDSLSVGIGFEAVGASF